MANWVLQQIDVDVKEQLNELEDDTVAVWISKDFYIEAKTDDDPTSYSATNVLNSLKVPDVDDDPSDLLDFESPGTTDDGYFKLPDSFPPSWDGTEKDREGAIPVCLQETGTFYDIANDRTRYVVKVTGSWKKWVKIGEIDLPEYE